MESSNTSIHTIKNYIEILKELFIFVELRPYFTNKSLELVKIPKLYFLDAWVRNYFIRNFNSLDLRKDKWTLFECFFIGELLKKWVDKETIKYWNDKNKREVDIVIDDAEIKNVYELKFQKNIKSDDLIWLGAFEKMYQKKWSLVNLDFQGKRQNYDFILPFTL